MNKSNHYVQLSLLSVTILLFGMFVFPSVYSETISFTTPISPITILSDEFIPLLDTSTTGNLTSISVTANLPCDSSNNPLVTIVAGILGDTTGIIDSSSDFIGNGPRDTCVFRDNITNVTAANIPTINSMFLNHTGSSPVHIPQGVTVTLSGIFENQISAPVLPIALDGTVQTSSGTASTTDSVTLTIGSNDNRVLIVTVEDRTDAVTSVKIDTTNFTLAKAHVGGGHHTEIWYLVNPPTGSQTIDVVFDSEVASHAIGVMSLYNVDQTTPIGATAGDNGASAQQPNGSITPTNTDAWIVDSLSTSSTGASVASLTSAYVITPASNTYYSSQYDTTPTIDSSNSMDWSGLAGGYTWGWSAIEVMPVQN